MVQQANKQNGKASDDKIKVDKNAKSKIEAPEFSKKSKFLCMFCGGKSCKKENYLKNTKQNAIVGLHSNWITPEILAMQRPSQRLLKEFEVIPQFKNAHIQAVFNLQLPGEPFYQEQLEFNIQHPYCGEPLIKESGFTYKAEDFTDRNFKQIKYVYINYKDINIQYKQDGIYFFNFGWTDMEVTENDYMIKIISLIDMTISQGKKIAVHCHAGTGRTGLLIASWLILKNKMSAVQARDYFREKRAGGLSKSKQLTFLKKFEDQFWFIDYYYVKLVLNQSRISFLNKNIFKIEEIIKAQEKLVFGKEKTQSRYYPFIMFQVLSRLESLMENKRIKAVQLCKSFFDLNDSEYFADSQWSASHEQQIIQLKELINKFQWQFSNYGDLRIISQVLLDFFDQPNLQVIKNESAMKLDEHIKRSQSNRSQSIEHVFADENIVNLLANFQYLLRKTLSIKKQTKICISLLGKKRDLDILFIERSFQQTECKHQVVVSLYDFLQTWLAEMVDAKMTDNSFFDKIFLRTATIIEGKNKLEVRQPSRSVGNQIYPIPNENELKRAENILIGHHQRNEQKDPQIKQDELNVKNFTDINEPLRTKKPSENKSENSQNNELSLQQVKSNSQSSSEQVNQNKYQNISNDEIPKQQKKYSESSQQQENKNKSENNQNIEIPQQQKKYSESNLQQLNLDKNQSNQNNEISNLQKQNSDSSSQKN